MYKFLVLFLFAVSAGSFGVAMYDYATSGEQLVEGGLKSSQGIEDLPPVDITMSPLRVFLEVTYEMDVKDVSTTAYEYKVDIVNPVGQVVGGEARSHSEKKEDRGGGFMRNKMTHIVDTVEIDQNGVYQMNWQVTAKRAKVLSIAYEIRHNVSEMNIPLLLLAGFCFAMGWIVLFFGRRSA